MKGTLLVTDDGPSIPYYYDSQIITIEQIYTSMYNTKPHAFHLSISLILKT